MRLQQELIKSRINRIITLSFEFYICRFDERMRINNFMLDMRKSKRPKMKIRGVLSPNNIPFVICKVQVEVQFRSCVTRLWSHCFVSPLIGIRGNYSALRSNFICVCDDDRALIARLHCARRL